jgi:hypothetical protein
MRVGRLAMCVMFLGSYACKRTSVGGAGVKDDEPSGGAAVTEASGGARGVV